MNCGYQIIVLFHVCTCEYYIILFTIVDTKSYVFIAMCNMVKIHPCDTTTFPLLYICRPLFVVRCLLAVIRSSFLFYSILLFFLKLLFLFSFFLVFCNLDSGVRKIEEGEFRFPFVLSSFSARALSTC